MNRAEILGEATRLVCEERQATHGNALGMHDRIGRIWGAILGDDDIDPTIVALMMAGLKIARASKNLAHEDNYVDLAGYAALAGEISKTGGPK